MQQEVLKLLLSTTSFSLVWTYSKQKVILVVLDFYVRRKVFVLHWRDKKKICQISQHFPPLWKVPSYPCHTVYSAIFCELFCGLISLFLANRAHHKCTAEWGSWPLLTVFVLSLWGKTNRFNGTTAQDRDSYKLIRIDRE